MHALKSATPAEFLDSDFSPTGRTSDIYKTSSSVILERGRHYFAKTYGKVADQITRSLSTSSEDLGHTALLNYSYILSNVKVLSARESSFTMLAGLIPQDVNAQLKGHLRGALNHGSTTEEVGAVRDAVIRICKHSGMAKLGHQQCGWGWTSDVASL